MMNVFLTTALSLPLTLQQGPLEMQFFPRSPDQMTAFYSSRKFPREMIEILAEQCFVTVGIKNTGKQKLWLDLSRWEFFHRGKALPRPHRNYWLQRWKEMGMPQASISTFRWTLIPEQLDYLPGEEEGGNVILPRVTGPITLRARFATGDDQQGKPLEIQFDALYCAENAE